MLIIPIFIAHQGCPHDCLFCNQYSITRKEKEGCNTDTFTTSNTGETTNTISETISLWLKRNQHGEKTHKYVEVAFFGGSFTCLPLHKIEQLLSEVQPFIERDEVQSIRCSTRPDCVTPEICEFLQINGIRTIELGVQSLSESVLTCSRRGHSVKESVQAITLLKQFGFTTGVQLMPGLPDTSKNGRESALSFLRGLRHLLALSDGNISVKPDMIRLYPTLVLKETALETLYNQGRYQPLTIEEATLICAIAMRLCQKANVPVIRTGLQASPSLEDSLIAGAWHPAFGELVQSRLWFAQMKQILHHFFSNEELTSKKKKKTITFSVSHRDLSAVIGSKQKNKKRLDAIGYKGRYIINCSRSLNKGHLHYVVNK